MIFEFQQNRKINIRDLIVEIKESLGDRAKNCEVSVLEEPHTRTMVAPNGTEEVFFYGYKIQISGVEADALEVTGILDNHRPQKSSQEEKAERAIENTSITRKEFNEFKADVERRLLELEEA